MVSGVLLSRSNLTDWPPLKKYLVHVILVHFWIEDMIWNCSAACFFFNPKLTECGTFSVLGLQASNRVT